jgi:hypothetical protein
MFRLSRAGSVAAALALTGAAALVQIATTTPASAAPSRVVSAASATNSIARKSAIAYCPTGTRVFGGGGDIVAGGNSVALTGLKPTSLLINGQHVDSFTATAEEGQVNYVPNWTVYAYAICGPNLANLSIQWFRVTSGAADHLQTGANCPSGTAPVGLGAEVGNGLGQVALTQVLGNYTLSPQGVPTGWSGAAAYEDETGYSGTWTLTSYAVCASPPPGLSYRFADSAVTSLDKGNTPVECPIGTSVYGVGGYFGYNTGQLHFDRMVPHGSNWTGADIDAREDATGFTPNWYASVEAICAK